MSYTVLLRDFGTRTAASSWGTPLAGPAWTTSGGSAADYAVSGGFGSMSLASVSVMRSTVSAVASADVDLRFDVALGGGVPTGGGVELGARVRYVDASNFVDIRLFPGTANTVTMAIRQLVAGVETFVGFPVVPGVTANSTISVHLVAFGNQLMAKAWPAGTPEPASWSLSMTTTMLTAGSVLLYGTLSAAYANTLPAPLLFSNLVLATGITPLGFVYPTDADLLCGTGLPVLTALEQLAESVQAFLTSTDLDDLATAATAGTDRAQTVAANYSVTSFFNGPMDSVVFNSGTPTDLAVFPNGNIVDTGIWWEIQEAVVPQNAGMIMASVGSEFTSFSATTDANGANPEFWGGGNQSIRLRRTIPNFSDPANAGWTGTGASMVFTWIVLSSIRVSENVT